MCAKVVNIILEDEEHASLTKAKGEKTWKEALKEGCK